MIDRRKHMEIKMLDKEAYKMRLGTSRSLSFDREEESECRPSYRTPLNAFPAPLDDKAW